MSTNECNPRFDLDLWQDFPEVSNCREDGLRYSLGALEGFEELMDLTPRASTESFAAHGFAEPVLAPELNHEAEDATQKVESAPQARRTAADSRRLKNRNAQKRLRQRQRVKIPVL